MRNKFLGVICLLYSAFILFLFMTHQIGKFLIPKMQTYLFIATIVVIIIGVFLLFSVDKEKCKIGDILFLFPLILFLFMGDGKINLSSAGNRSHSFSSKMNTSKIEEKKEKKKETEKLEELEKMEEKEETTTSIISSDNKPSIDSIEIEVEDITYAGLSDQITYSTHPEKLVGKTIQVRGFVLKNVDFIPKGTFGIGKYLISCCAADSSFIGFIVEGDSSTIQENGWYEIEGILKLGEDSYQQKIVVIDMVQFKKISPEEEQYVYPCYSYGDGSCSEVLKYNLS